MTNNADAQVARQWAEGFIKHADSAQIVDADALIAARHILATTTPPTMADVEWDDAVHAGLCALCADGDLVRMIGPSLGNGGAIICHWVYCDSTVTGALQAEILTPIPGTKIDLTPRREPGPEPEPGSDPDHPFELTTEADYRNAPKGTVVAMSAEAWTKTAENEWSDPTGRADDKYMSSRARRVLRWGWAA